MKRKAVGLRLATAAVLVFLHFPIAIIVLYAFTTQRSSFRFPPPSLTLDWFQAARDNPAIWDAMRLSLEVALVATTVALVL